METEVGLPERILGTRYTKVCNFKGDPERWSRFKEECKARGVSICQVMDALMEAWIQGQKTTATVIKPVTVNLTMQHVVKRPRRISPFPDDIGAENIAEYITRYGSCYRLEPQGLYPGRIGWCRWLKKWIQGHECATCIHSGERH